MTRILVYIHNSTVTAITACPAIYDPSVFCLEKVQRYRVLLVTTYALYLVIIDGRFHAHSECFPLNQKSSVTKLGWLTFKA